LQLGVILASADARNKVGEIAVATYNLSGTGDQALTTGTTRLQVDVTNFRANAQVGDARPANYFHLGLLRVGAGTRYAPVRPIDAASMFIDLPYGATVLSYALFGGTTISVTEQTVGGVGRPMPWDRNPANINNSFHGGIGTEGAETDAWTYTVPAARILALVYATAALVVTQAYTSGFSAFAQIYLNGTLLLRAAEYNVASGSQNRDDLAGGTLYIPAGGVLRASHTIAGTAGTTLVTLGAAGYLFDA
jgi:hypothetical protein